MSTKFDGKFHGVVVKNKNGSVVPPDQWMVFLVKDNAFPATLKFYLEECKRWGANKPQLQAIQEAIERMERWRGQNLNLCKTPDVDPGELIV